jgi:DNA-binding beta-propeller fold protein YncE
VIDGATCDAVSTAGCGQTPVLMGLGLRSSGPGSLPWGIAVDATTDTVYAALNANADYGGAVAVINGATCNGSVTAGCGQIAPLVPAGFNSIGVAVDPLSQSVYVSNLYDASVSVIDGTTCNRFVTFGCARVPLKLPAAHFPASVVVDPAARTVYVATLGEISVLPLAR